MAARSTPHPAAFPGTGGEILPAMRLVGSTNNARVLARVLMAMFGITVVALIFAPWVQNVQGSGQVIAVQPLERSQTIDAPVEGRIHKWHVVEGTKVKQGDLVAELRDNDPLVLLRREEERFAVEQRSEQGRLRATSLESRIHQLDATRRNELNANSNRIAVAVESVRAAEQQIKAGEADLLSQKQNLERTRQLLGKGLASVRTVELAEQSYQTAAANVDRYKAQLAAAHNDKLAREADQSRIETQYQTQIQDARASLASARADVQNILAELKRMEIAVARQSTQNVTAPRNGTVLRLLAQPGSELVKAGDPIAQFVPESGSLAVALMMQGNDTPLIHKGDLVRLQFEGWPAVQFAGWPSVAVGTFGGRVLLVDPTDDGKGKFRILVEPDASDQPWPEARYLRQGVRANGWVLLRQVPLGFELWRRFNGFPPAISAPEGDASASGTKGGKK